MLRNLKGHPLRYASSAASSFTEVNSGVASVAGLEYAPLNSEEAVGKGHPLRYASSAASSFTAD